MKHLSEKAPAMRIEKKADRREKTAGGSMMGEPYPLDKLTDLISALGSDEMARSLPSAKEIIENYSAVSRAVSKSPDINMTQLNDMLNSVIERNLAMMISLLGAKNPPLGLNFLANSISVRSEAVRDAARTALERLGKGASGGL